MSQQKDLKEMLEEYGGENVENVVKRFVDLALGKGQKTNRLSPHNQALYCSKIIEFYHGKPGENKTINNNIQISMDSKVTELTKLITKNNKEIKNKIIDVTPLQLPKDRIEAEKDDRRNRSDNPTNKEQVSFKSNGEKLVKWRKKNEEQKKLAIIQRKKAIHA